MRKALEQILSPIFEENKTAENIQVTLQNKLENKYH